MQSYIFRILIASFLLFGFLGCGGGSSSSNHSSSEQGQNSNSGGGTNNTGNNNNGSNSSVNQDDTPSSWHVASTLYDYDIKKSFFINGNKCEVWQDKEGIGYRCEDNLSSNGSFDYESVAKIVTPSLYHISMPSTNKEIVIAESNVSKMNFSFLYPPIIYKGYMYANLNRSYEKEINQKISLFNHYEVNEYNLSKFTQDTTLESLISKSIFTADREKPSLYSQSVSSMMEINGYLYFNAFPIYGDAIEYNGGGAKFSMPEYLHYENHKYDLRNRRSVYSKDSYPIYKYKTVGCNYLENTNLEQITHGWMVPGSGTKIAFLDKERMTQIDACSGKDIRVIEESLTAVGKSCRYSVKVDQRDPKGDLSYQPLSVSNASHYFSINGDELSKTTFERQGKTHFGHSNVDKSINVLNDFIDKYGNSKSYTNLQLQDEMILDKNSLYLLGELRYDSEEAEFSTYPKAYYDLYLFKYNTDLKLQEATLILSSKKTSLPPHTQHFYKYKENLYFKYDDEFIRKLISYNLAEKKISFTYKIDSSRIDPEKYIIPNVSMYDYAITGKTIILPLNLRSENGGDNYFDLGFRVLDIDTGSVIKTIKSDRLKQFNRNDYTFKSMGSYVYGDNVYFVFKKSHEGEGNDYTRSLLVKIASPGNKTKITRYRGDNRLTGVIRNAYIESALEPKNDKERLVIELYHYLNDNEADFNDLNRTLVNYIAKEKSTTLQTLFETPKPQSAYTEYNLTSLDVNFTNIEQYDQTTPLYNTELLGNTQTFYIPLLKEVAYSSTGEDGPNDLGEARLHINAQYGCQKSYFKFPYHGSYKLYGFDPINSDREFNNPIPESLTFKTDVPMIVVDYDTLFENQSFLRYGIDAAEYDSLNTAEKITRTLKESIDSLISITASIAMGNYASTICSISNIITTYAINSMNEGDTYYGSAMRMYTVNSNFGIENNRTFSYDTIEGSAKSLKIDADAAGDLVENICAGVSLNPATIVSFITKADYDEKHVKAKVLPTWHRGIEIKKLDIKITDIKFVHTPLIYLKSPHTLKIRGRIATLGTQNVTNAHHTKSLKEELQPFAYQTKIHQDLSSDSNSQFKGWSNKIQQHPIEFEAIFAKSGIQKHDSIAGTYLEMTFYSDDIQMGIFTDTLFLDEAIFTNNFIKNGKRYSKTVTKPFYFPDQTPAMKRPINGTVTYTVSFEVE